jgi:anaerobic selenocysteine-containing dehydrogenase
LDAPGGRARPGERRDWEIILEIAERTGGGITGIAAVDGLLRLSGTRITPSALASFALRTGAYGDRFLPWRREGLTRERLHAHPHGVDLGPLKPGFRRRVFHRDGRAHLAPRALMQAMDALADELATRQPPPLLLIGRRELRSNNSWMHNVPRLIAGHKRCLLYVHPDDAARVGLADGGRAVMRSRVAGAQPGASANDWIDDGDVESVVGMSILNGVPVELRADIRGPSGDLMSSPK